MNVSKGSLSVLKVGGEEIKRGEGGKRGNLLAEPDMRSVCGSVRWGWYGDRSWGDDGGGVGVMGMGVGVG